MPNIFDFDQTVTHYHTFSNSNLTIKIESGDLELKPGMNPHELMKNKYFEYLAGNNEISLNFKNGIEEYLKHDKDNLSAIATFHNNPSFVAGYIAKVLNKKLDYKEQKIHKITDEFNIAVNVYSVEGEDKPFYISYLPYIDEFNKAVDFLKNKNEQIKFIHSLWMENNLIDTETKINFYDDSTDNIDAANYIDFINCYKVDPQDKNFAFTESSVAASSYTSVTESSEEVPINVEVEENTQQFQQRQRFFQNSQSQGESTEENTETTESVLKNI